MSSRKHHFVAAKIATNTAVAAKKATDVLIYDIVVYN